jgi:hypothetical protein
LVSPEAYTPKRAARRRERDEIDVEALQLPHT